MNIYFSTLLVLFTIFFINTDSAHSLVAKHVYNRSYNNVYTSIILYCKESNYELEFSDINSGKIITKYKPIKYEIFRKEKLIFNLKQLSSYETEVNLESIYTPNNPLEDVSRLSNIIDAIHYNTGIADIQNILLSKYSLNHNESIIVFNFSSNFVKEWDSKILINSSEKFLRIKSGELYEVRTSEKTLNIKYYLRSFKLFNNDFQTIYQTGNSSYGSIQYKTISLSPKKGDILMLNIEETGNIIDASMCLPIFLNLFIPFPLTRKFVEVSFHCHKVN